ncbi:MAG TPA: histone deacetylase [Gemmatimonadaceae bacterium]|nr:histone deacetylase [Gemmatimonadaceae bacterium]
MALPLWSSARYTIPLPAGHRFPIAKYARLRQRVVEEGLVRQDAIREPARASREALLRAHDAGYVESFQAGRLSPGAVRRLGLPWSPALVERAWRAVGGTCEAAEAALSSGIAMNLAGGTHHAFRDRGEGFCVFNDVAVALLALLAAARIRRAAVIDLDVHQGNGTHAIFAHDERVFTFSMHGRRNYPFHRVPGAFDVELEDGTGDAEYLTRLAAALPRVLAQAQPDLVMYLAGADPHEGDRLGRLRLTFDGLARRDAMVLEACREVGIPVAITIAGGYGHEIETTVEAHLRTVRVARDFA